MGRMKERTIAAMNNTHHGVRSDGAGSPYIVLDAKTGKVVSGVLVLFPHRDLRASELLTRYAETMQDSCPDKHDLTQWAQAVSASWEQALNDNAWENDGQGDES
jgi:hypothetical protein